MSELNPVRCWLGTVSRDHVRRGVADGFAQVGHGRGGPLRRMKRGDWLVYYSPRTSLNDGDPLQAFTAIGQVADDEVVQVEIGPDFKPWRRNVHFRASKEAPIRNLLDSLSFMACKPNWRYAFRRGHFEVSADDFAVIATAMEADVSG